MPYRHQTKEKGRPFEFRQCISIIKSTGKKAVNLRQLREIIATVGDDSIFHHTFQYFLKEHILEYTNDFAQWAGESLEERALAEQLSNIDPYDCEGISEVRASLVSVIDSYLEKFPEPAAYPAQMLDPTLQFLTGCPRS